MWKYTPNKTQLSTKFIQRVNRHAPDRFWSADDRLDNVLADEHLVGLVYTERGRVRHLGHLLLFPELTHHVLQVDHTCTGNRDA